MTLSLPSWSNTSFAERSEPSASPSGFSCVVKVKRSCPRIAAATAARSLAVVWGELIDQLRHPDPPLNRRIVFERELGSPLHAELARDSRLQNRVCSLQAGQRALAPPLGAEDRNEDSRVPQIGGGLDAGDSD